MDKLLTTAHRLAAEGLTLPGTRVLNRLADEITRIDDAAARNDLASMVAALAALL